MNIEICKLRIQSETACHQHAVIEHFFPINNWPTLKYTLSAVCTHVASVMWLAIALTHSALHPTSISAHVILTFCTAAVAKDVKIYGSPRCVSVV